MHTSSMGSLRAIFFKLELLDLINVLLIVYIMCCFLNPIIGWLELYLIAQFINNWCNLFTVSHTSMVYYPIFTDLLKIILIKCSGMFFLKHCLNKMYVCIFHDHSQSQVLFYAIEKFAYYCFRCLLDFVTCVTVDRLERDAYPLFRTLRQKYKPSTDRDPVFEEVVPFILYFIVHLRRKHSGRSV
jgi:hypothetical protein